MAGKKGRSGRKPLSTVEHLLNGTFRADRHASRLQQQSPEIAAGPPELDPAALARLGDGLGDSGRQLVADVLRQFPHGWTARDLRILRTAAETSDRLTEIRALLARQGLTVSGPRFRSVPNPLLRLERQTSTALIGALRALDLNGSPAPAPGFNVEGE